jgi:chorismate mutase
MQVYWIWGKKADEIGLVKKRSVVLQSKRWNEILGKMILEGEKRID